MPTERPQEQAWQAEQGGEKAQAAPAAAARPRGITMAVEATQAVRLHFPETPAPEARGVEATARGVSP